eukprot:g4378.t1
MASGAIQAAVGRLQTLPPPSLSIEECCRAQLEMLGQAAELIPEGLSSGSLLGNPPLEWQAAILAAQAHLAMAEVQIKLNAFPHGRQKPKQRASWYLEKGRSALHRAAAVAKTEDDVAVNLLLVHAHLLTQKLSQEMGPKKLEQGLEELLAAARIPVSVAAAEGKVPFAGCGVPLQLQAAWRETRLLLLDRIRSALRALCTGASNEGSEGWKELYRFSLKLQPTFALITCYGSVIGAPTVNLDDPLSLGQCTCDLTQAQCNVNCCCDPDCVGLTDSFSCLPEGPKSATTQYCYSKSWLHRVNPRVDLWVIADDLRGLLCVSVDNSAVQGEVFQNQAVLSSSQVDAIVQDASPPCEFMW